VCAWLVPAVPASAIRGVIALAIFVLIVAVCRAAVRPPEASGPRRLLAAVALIIVCYVGVLVYSRLMVGAGIEFDQRILAPVFTLAAVVVAAAVGVRWRSCSPVVRVATAAVVVGWLTLALRADAAAVRALRDEGYGYEAPDWQGSDFAFWLRSPQGGQRYQLFTNDPAAAYFLTGRPARLLPASLDAETVHTFATVVKAWHGAVLGFESYFDDVAPPESLAVRLGLREAIRFDYGAAWIPGDSAERRP
jgi:hypothetical protein